MDAFAKAQEGKVDRGTEASPYNVGYQTSVESLFAIIVEVVDRDEDVAHEIFGQLDFFGRHKYHHFDIFNGLQSSSGNTARKITKHPFLLHSQFYIASINYILVL